MYKRMQERTLFCPVFLVYCPTTIMREKQGTFFSIHREKQKSWNLFSFWVLWCCRVTCVLTSCCRGSRSSSSSFLWCRFNKGHEEDDFPTDSKKIYWSFDGRFNPTTHLLSAITLPERAVQLIYELFLSWFKITFTVWPEQLWLKDWLRHSWLTPIYHPWCTAAPRSPPRSVFLPWHTPRGHPHRKPWQSLRRVLQQNQGSGSFLHYCHMRRRRFFTWTSCLCSHLTGLQWDCTRGDLWRIHPILKVLNTVQWKLCHSKTTRLACCCTLFIWLWHYHRRVMEGWTRWLQAATRNNSFTAERETFKWGTHIRMFFCLFF